MISLPPALWEYWQQHQQSVLIMGMLGMATAVMVSYWCKRGTVATVREVRGE